jgi:signal transduction histidine kinase
MGTLRTGTYGEYYGSITGESEALSADEMSVNATYIYKALTAKSWSTNAISAILGNMQAESSINAGRWQSDEVNNMSAGFGIVQWTPATKYIDWASEQGYTDYTELDNQLTRIQYEVDNGLQWISTATYAQSFTDFTKSIESVGTLAKMFLLNYERPADQSESVQEYRASLAENWYNYLMNTEDTGGGVTRTKRKGYNFLLFNRRKRVQRYG